jgi:hypothetical protein
MDVWGKKPFRREQPYNPLDPRFKIRDEQDQLIEVGPIAGGKPRESYVRNKEDERDFSLKCRDIDGNHPGTTMLGNFHSRARKEFREPTKNDDIKGSKAGTLVRGIKMPEGMKIREINPLQPTYVYPGAKEKPIDSLNDPFGRSGCSMTKQSIQKRNSKPPVPPLPPSKPSNAIDSNRVSENQKPALPSAKSRSHHSQ